MSDIKILHCIRQGQIGGGESHVIDLVKNLNRSAFSSSVLSFTNGPMIDRLTDLGIQVFVIPTTWPFDFRVWKKVSKIIKDNRFDLIHIHGTRAFSNCFISAKKYKIPIVYTVHGWSFNDYQSWLRNKLSVITEKYFTRLASVVINVSKSNRQTGSKYIPKLKSVVIQNGIDTKIFTASGSFPDIRQEFNIDSTKIVIGFIARMTYQKDPLTLIRAFHLLTKKKGFEKRYTLLMIGDGDKKAEAIELVNELKLSALVHFESFRDDVPNLLNAINIFCLPSLWEGLPLSVLEAMAMKKIVVASLVDGTQEVITSNQNGYLFTPGDSEQLCQLLEEASEPTTRNEQIRLNALKTIQENFTLECMIQKTEQVYFEAATSKPLLF